MNREKEIGATKAMDRTQLGRSKFDKAIDNPENYLPRRNVGGSVGRLFRPSDVDRWVAREYELAKAKVMARRGIKQVITPGDDGAAR